MFGKRSYDKEIMDDFSITDERISLALKELEVINKYLGGRSTSRKGLKHFQDKINAGEKIKILDIGSGGSDIFKNINGFEKQIELFGIDINKGVCRYAQNNGLHGNIICADAHTLPFKSFMFDIIHVSLFMHHFKEEEIKELLRYFLSLSRYGIIINDLHRSIFAYAGIRFLTRLFSKSKMVINDAPLSVKRSFRKKELVDICTQFNLSSIIVEWRWAFRWLVVLIK